MILIAGKAAHAAAPSDFSCSPCVTAETYQCCTTQLRFYPKPVHLIFPQMSEAKTWFSPLLFLHGHTHSADQLSGWEQHLADLPQLIAETKRPIVAIVPESNGYCDDFRKQFEQNPYALVSLVEEAKAALKIRAGFESKFYGQFIVAAHSGAYRPLAHALESKTVRLKISEIYLFDALYEYGKVFAMYAQMPAKRFWSFTRNHKAYRKARNEFLANMRPEVNATLFQESDTHDLHLSARTGIVVDALQTDHFQLLNDHFASAVRKHQ